MAELKFKDLDFEDHTDFVRVNFLRLFFFDIKREKLEKISKFKIKCQKFSTSRITGGVKPIDNRKWKISEHAQKPPDVDGTGLLRVSASIPPVCDGRFLTKHEILFEDASEKRVSNKFSQILAEGFKDLRNKLNTKRAIYVHQNCGIPLIGSNSFGLVDRNTNIIEIKPITCCNLNCIYCSVDQSLRARDFVVEKDYIVDEFRKLLAFKECGCIEAHIGGQGEPLLYAPLIDLIRDIKRIKEVKTISIDTNGTLLSMKIVDDLIAAGLTRFNFSLNALGESAGKIAGVMYNVGRIKEMLEYISKKKVELLIAPVMMQDVNEKEIDDIIRFSKELGVKTIGIQNYLSYDKGKKGIKEMEWEKFFDKLKALEKKHEVKLIFAQEDFDIEKTKKLPKPFKKGDIVTAEIICDGRFKNEKIAVAKGRNISVFGCNKKTGTAKIKILRDKHNIFVGECV